MARLMALRPSWLRSIWAILRFEARKLRWLIMVMSALILGQLAILIFLVDRRFSRDFLLLEFGTYFGRPSHLTALCLYTAMLSGLGLGFAGFNLDRRRGFSLLLAAPWAQVLGRFVLAAGLGLAVTLTVFLGKAHNYGSAGLPIAWGPSLGFFFLGFLALGLPVTALSYLLGWASVRGQVFYVALLILAMLGINTMKQMIPALAGEPGMEFPPALGHLLHWPQPLPQAVMPAQATEQVVAFPGIPWSWAALGLLLTMLFLKASHGVACRLPFAFQPPAKGQAAWSQSRGVATARVFFKNPRSPLAAFLLVESKSFRFFPMASLAGLFCLWPFLWSYLVADGGLLPPGYTFISTMVMLCFLSVMVGLINGFARPLWPPMLIPGLPPCTPWPAVLARGLGLAFALGLLGLLVLPGLAVYLALIHGFSWHASTLLVLAIYALAVFALPLAAASLLLGAWRGVASGVAAWLVLVTALPVLLAVGTGLWALSFAVLPPWPLPGFALGGIDTQGLYALPQEPFWLSLLASGLAVWLAQRLFQESQR